MYYGLKASSRSRTDFSSLIRIVVRFGYWSCGVLCAVTRAGYWGICSVRNVGQGNDREEVTYESETVQYGFDYSSSKWGAAQLAHVLRYRYITCYWRVVVDDHVYYIEAQLEPFGCELESMVRTFIGILDTLLDCICRFTKCRFPHLSMDEHECRQESNFAFRVLRGRLISPCYELKGSCAHSITQSV